MGDRERFSKCKLEGLRNAIQPGLNEIVGEFELCVYATGSFGRLEAWEESDADLFLLYSSGGADSRRIGRLLKLRIFGRLIEAVNSLDFEDFDGDGKFLDLHDLLDMREALGSEKDDGVNAFTARMLLLLESRPVFGDDVYSSLLSEIVGFYFDDEDDHQDNFEPYFLLNDILRFWRTLTLNYEHGRYKLRQGDTKHGQDAAGKSALKNYKLKFSRLITCFSMVAWLVSREGIQREDVVRACGLTPMGRLREVAGDGRQEEILDELAAAYGQFLAVTQRSEAEVLSQFNDVQERRELTTEASKFGDLLFELIWDVSRQPIKRYLVI